MESVLKEKRRREEQEARKDNAKKDVDHYRRLESEQAILAAQQQLEDALEDEDAGALDGASYAQEPLYRQVLYLEEVRLYEEKTMASLLILTSL